MEFIIKKIISALLLPLPIGLIGIALGILFIVINRSRRFGIVCLSFGFLCLLIFSMPPVSNYLINQLQSQYAPLLQPPLNVKQIVVLGGGVSGDKQYPPNLTLNSASLSRLIEGIRLFKLLEQQQVKPELILSGGRVFESPSNAGMMQNTALMLGVHAKQTLLENGSRDTREEALYLKKTVGHHPFILVTSAYHMPRSIALFEAEGMHPIAAPTQFINAADSAVKAIIPNATSLLVSDIAIHEYFGLLWAKMNDFI